jgi:hypothetical protein
MKFDFMQLYKFMIYFGISLLLLFPIFKLISPTKGAFTIPALFSATTIISSLFTILNEILAKLRK